MTIQLNADNNLSIKESFREKLTGLLADELDRFSDFITRLEVHFSDENGPKKGQLDKRCLLEARLKGMQPIVVSGMGDTHEISLAEAIDKLKVSLDTKIGRLKEN